MSANLWGNLVWVGLGGASGAMLRYLVVALASQPGFAFPLGTLIVNTVGSLLIGLLAGYLLHSDASHGRLFFQTGLLGAFTTFSAFSLDTLVLWQQGFWRLALANVLISVFLCLLAVAIGFAASSHFTD
jgi:CrcB protein